MRIVKASAGDTLMVYDSGYAAVNDDYMIIKVKRDLQFPIQIDTFEMDYEDDYVLARYYRHNGLDGHVSFLSIQGCYA